MIAEYAPGATGTSSRPADLAKVVCADPDLLALEFDALMAANYPDLVDRPDPRPPRRTVRLLTRRLPLTRPSLPVRREGWPYSFVAALEPGRTSWTALLDAARLGPADDVTAVTAQQLRTVLGRLVAAGHWQPGDPNVLIVTDAGYDVTRLAFVLSDLPVDLVGRIRCDRVLRLPKPPRAPGTTGRPPRHGPEIALNKPATWPQPQHSTSTDTSRYGTATATSWDRVHPRLTHRGCWIDHHGELPVIEGTLIRLQVEHLPGDRNPKPVWLWSSITGATTEDVDRWWQAFLRRLDLEHTFRLLKQTLGWTRPKIRTPEAADRWTWLIIAAHTQLRLARPLAEDLRHPWEKPAPPGRLTPARVRRGFRNIRAKSVLPARAPKPTRPGPGRPPGSRNRRPAPRYDVGKTVKRDRTITARQQRTGSGGPGESHPWAPTERSVTVSRHSALLILSS